MVFIFQISCGSDDTELDHTPEPEEEIITENPEPEPESLFADVLKLGKLPNVLPTSSSDTLNTKLADPKVARQLFNGNIEDVRFKCTEYSIEGFKTKNSFPIWGAPSTAVFPGSFIQGNSLVTGRPTPIPAKRAGGTLTLSAADNSLLGTVDITEFNNTQVSLGRSELLSQQDPTPSSFQLTVGKIANGVQLAFEMGLPIADFEALFANTMAVDQTTGVTSFLVSLKQEYYGLDYELPLGMEDYFDASVESSDIEPYVTASNLAAFISRVGHGRQFYVLIETTTFGNTAEEKIQEAFSSFADATEGTLNTDMLNDLDALSLKVAIRSNTTQGPYEEIGTLSTAALADLLSEPVAMTTA